MKQRLLAFFALIPLLAASVGAQTPPPATPTTTTGPNETPDDYPDTKDCYKCNGEGDFDSTVESDEDCPQGTAEKKQADSIYYTVGLGTTSYVSKNNFVARDLGKRKPKFASYNAPITDEPPFASSLSGEWKGKLVRPVTIGLVTETIEERTFTPAALEFYAGNSGNAWVKRDSSNALRQILTNQYLTDIIVPSGGGVLISTYLRSTIGTLDPSTGLYTIPGNARKFRAVLISRPTPTGLDTVDITTTDYSSSETMPKVRGARWVKSGTGSSASWTLTHHTGAPTTQNQYASNELARQDLGGGLVQRTRTIRKPDSIGNPVIHSVTREKYRDLGDGTLRIVESVEAPGTPEELATTYTYTDITGTGTVGVSGTNTQPDANATINRLIGARLHSLQRSDGYWEEYQYQYNGGTRIMLTQKWSSWKNSAFGDKANSRHTSITLEANARTVIEKVAGQIVSNVHETLTIASDGSRTLREERQSGSATPLVTEHGYFSDGAGEPAKSRIKYTRHPDGTLTRYSYANVADFTASGQTARKTTIERGAAGANQFAPTATGAVPALTTGTRTLEIANTFEKVIDIKTYDIASGLILSQATVATVDAVGRPTQIIYDADPDDYEAFTFACCGVKTHRTRDGSLTDYTKDALERPTLTTVTLGSKTTSTGYNYSTESISGRNLPKVTVTLTISAGANTTGSLLVSQSIENLRGQIVVSRSPDANGDNTPDETIHNYNVATRTESSTGPDSVTVTRTSYADGQTHTSISNFGGDPITTLTTHDYAPHNLNGGGIKTTTTSSDGATVIALSASYTNLAGRTFRNESPGYNGATLVSETTFDERGRATGQSSTGKPATLRVLDFLGKTTQFWTDANGDGQLNNTAVAGIKDTCHTSATSYVTEDGTVCQRTQSWIRNDADGDILLSTTFSSPDGLYQKSIPLSGPVTLTTATAPLNGSASSDTRSYLSSTAYLTQSSTITLNGDGTTTAVSVNKNTAGATVTTSTQIADLQGRLVSTSGGRTPATTYADFTAAGQPLKTTQGDGTYTTTELDTAARPITQRTYKLDATLIATAHTTYHPTGQVAAQYGTNTNPTYKIYDLQGRLKYLRTYRSTNLALAPDEDTPDYDTTTWNYESATGLLLSKRDAADKGATYTYTTDGKLLTRAWARGVTTTYGYNSASQLSTTTYTNDPLNTPGVSITYDRLGRQTSVTQANQSQIVTTYDPATLDPDTETISYDLDHDGTYEFFRVLDRKPTSLGRPTGFDLKHGNAIENQATYGYNAIDGRLFTVAGGTATSPPSFTYGYVPNSNLLHTVNGPIHTVINQWEDNRDVLDFKQNKVGTLDVSKYDYAVNELGQRTGVNTSGSEFPALPAWLWGYDSLGQITNANHSGGSTHDRGYLYDAIGNRRGQQIEATIVPTNQQGQIVPTTGTTTYSANTLNQYAGTGAISGSLNAAPVFDLDGNMTTGPLSGTSGSAANHLRWDAENRLAQVRAADDTAVITTALYDAQSRRIAEITNGVTTLFLYDGWNCIAEYTGSTLSKTRLWGTDLSGSMQGAGGVGGMLAETHHSGTAATYFPTYDGNGNVSEYLATNGSVAAHFEYDPFGNTVASTDTGNLFTYRFSTKPLVFTTGLYYYGYRHYDPVTGRWPSRDLIGELGGYNLSAFISNKPIYSADVLGLWKLKFALDFTKKFAGGRGFVTFNTRVDIENGNGSANFGATVGMRFFFTEMIPGLQAGAGTIIGVILETANIHQEVRVGGGVRGKVDCSCPDESTNIECRVTELYARLQAQGRLGYEGDDARLIGTVTGGGQWNLLNGEISLFGSAGIRGQVKVLGIWSGFEIGDSGDTSESGQHVLPIPFKLPHIDQPELNIPVGKKCKCMKDDIAGDLESVFSALGN